VFASINSTLNDDYFNVSNQWYTVTFSMISGVRMDIVGADTHLTPSFHQNFVTCLLSDLGRTGAVIVVASSDGSNKY